MEAIILLAVVLALGSTLLTDRSIGAASKPRWLTVVVAWVLLSSVSILLLLWHYTSIDPKVSLNAWHEDGIFKVLAFTFWNSVLITLVNILLLGVLAVRRRRHRKAGPPPPAARPDT